MAAGATNTPAANAAGPADMHEWASCLAEDFEIVFGEEDAYDPWYWREIILPDARTEVSSLYQAATQYGHTEIADDAAELLKRVYASMRRCRVVPDVEPLQVLPPEAVRRDWNAMRRWVAPLIFDRDGFACARCGISQRLTVDHIIAIDNGGQNRLSNFQTLCHSCNARKGNR